MKIIPRPDDLNGPYWEAAAAHRLVIQRCTTCGRYNHPPGVACPVCHGREFEWPTVSGRGRVYTYTVPYHSVHPVSADSVPYILALIELDEGPRLLTNLRDIAPEDVRVGLEVEVLFEDLDETTALPQFRPTDAAVGQPR